MKMKKINLIVKEQVFELVGHDDLYLEHIKNGGGEIPGDVR
jgi:hypothetical protein